MPWASPAASVYDVPARFRATRFVGPGTKFAEVLRKNNLLNDPKMPVILQSFDAETLKRAAKDIPSIPRDFLVAPQDVALLDSPSKLQEIRTWATGIAPNKVIVDKRPALVTEAHAAKLTVTLWTFRSKDTTFPSVRDEMKKFLDYGVDAVFTDNPDMFPR